MVECMNATKTCVLCALKTIYTQMKQEIMLLCQCLAANQLKVVIFKHFCFMMSY